MEGRRKLHRPAVRKNWKQRLDSWMAAVLTVSLVLGNTFCSANTAMAGQTSLKEEFRIHAEEIQKAAEKALQEGGAVTEEQQLKIGGKDKSLVKEYENLFEADGRLYEIFPAVEQVRDVDGIELRVFMRIGEEADPASYALTGEEEILFLYVNGGDENVSARLNIDGYVSGFSMVRAYDAVFGEKEAAPAAGSTGAMTGGSSISGGAAGGFGGSSGSSVDGEVSAADLTKEETAAASEAEKETTGETEAEAEKEAVQETAEKADDSESEPAEDPTETAADQTETEKETEAKQETEDKAEEKTGSTTDRDSANSAAEAEQNADSQNDSESGNSASDAKGEDEQKDSDESGDQEAGTNVVSMSLNQIGKVASTLASASDAEPPADKADAENENMSGSGSEEDADSDYDDTDNGDPFDEEDAAALEEEEKSFDWIGTLNGKMYNLISLDDCMSARAFKVTLSKLGVSSEELLEGGHIITYSVSPVGTATVLHAPELVRDEAVVTFGVVPQVGYEIRQVLANGEVLERAEDAELASRK